MKSEDLRGWLLLGVYSAFALGAIYLLWKMNKRGEETDRVIKERIKAENDFLKGAS